MSERTETIKKFHGCRNFGTADNLRNARREVAAAYRSLSLEECSTLARFAIENRGEKILSHLTCFHPDSLVGRHLELVQKGLIYPPEILHRADDKTTALLIRELDDGTAENVNRSLLDHCPDRDNNFCNRSKQCRITT